VQRLYQARDALEAQLLSDFLADRLIETVVLGQYLAGGVGELAAFNFPVVWVIEDADLAPARARLAEFLSMSHGPERWCCPRCGEVVEDGLLVCWNCGAPCPL
jgi:hypothetical protein